jgi:hypothetical protein
MARRLTNWKGATTMVVMTREGGFAVLRGREENEWLIAPFWPCSGRALRKVAPDKLPREWVDECCAFADQIMAESAWTGNESE